MTSPAPVSVALERLAHTAGGGAFLTHYGPAGERTELSVASFANWVAKTTNLLDDLGVGPGDVVTLPVLAGRPGHWMGLIWPFALWRAGLTAHLVADDADLAVIGPVAPQPVAPLTLACSLDAWARPLTDLPAGVTDYSGEALAQPDAAPLPPAASDEPAWVDAEGTLTGADLAAVDAVADRVLITPSTPRAALIALVGATLGGGSVVVVEPGGHAEPAAIAASERARVVA